MRKGVSKEEVGILHQIYRFRGDVNSGEAGFIKVKIGIIYDPFKDLR